MNWIKKGLGNIIYGLTWGLSAVLDILIYLVALTVSLVQAVAHGLAALLSLGGCLLLFLLFGPFGLFYLFHPVTIVAVLFFIIFPILGTKFVSLLRYVKYMMTEFLYDLSDYLTQGKDRTYKTFNEYGNQFRRKEQAKRDAERARRQEDQQKEWEARFRQWQAYQNQGQGGYRGYQGQEQGFSNPAIAFKSQYEESCDLLGVAYDADIYQIKLAYRQKAKEYHPDVNKADNATVMFKQVGSAYEFLSEANIARYRELT